MAINFKPRTITNRDGIGPSSTFASALRCGDLVLSCPPRPPLGPRLGGTVTHPGTDGTVPPGDSERVTSTMIAAGLSQLHNVDDELGFLKQTVEHVYRAMRAARGNS
jgi:hypothetical protein